MTESPVVRYEPGRGLVDADGGTVSDAQVQKARRILRHHLIQPIGRVLATHRRVVRLWTCSPLPGCSLTYALRSVERFNAWGWRDGLVTECDCQHARGTRVKDAGMCCHMLALRWLIADHDVEREECTEIEEGPD